MGMAKAAELNGEPGPKHVLDLVGQLELTETQRRDVQAIFDRMSAVAKPLGGQLIAQGQALDQLSSPKARSRRTSRWRRPPLPSFKVACAPCISRHISKRGRC